MDWKKEYDKLEKQTYDIFNLWVKEKNKRLKLEEKIEKLKDLVLSYETRKRF